MECLIRRAAEDQLPALLAFFSRAPWLATDVRPRDLEQHLRAGACWLAERAGHLAAAALVETQRHPVWQVQMVGCADLEALDEELGPLLAAADRAGQAAGAGPLLYIGDEPWLNGELPALGFATINRIAFYEREGRGLPEERGPGLAELRPAAAEDVPAALAVDHAAFDPIWWNSAAFLAQALDEFRFVVATAGGEVAGYSLCSTYPGEGHLARLAVHPAWQGRGIGGQLVRDALRFFWGCGLTRVLLNTQQDNERSQALYRRYGFRASGPTLPVWQMRRDPEGAPGI